MYSTSQIISILLLFIYNITYFLSTTLLRALFNVCDDINVAGPVCNMVTTVVRRPLDSRLEERDLTQLFSALPVPALLQLFGSLLLERKLILISNSLRYK